MPPPVPFQTLLRTRSESGGPDARFLDPTTEVGLQAPNETKLSAPSGYSIGSSKGSSGIEHRRGTDILPSSPRNSRGTGGLKTAAVVRVLPMYGRGNKGDFRKIVAQVEHGVDVLRIRVIRFEFMERPNSRDLQDSVSSKKDDWVHLGRSDFA